MIQTAALVASVPRIRQYRLRALPEGLSDKDASKLLSAINLDARCGRRDYAMCRSMLDLGLRSAEVAALRLDDVNWVRGVVSVKRSKSRRADILPLPPTMGRAVADYLRFARPRTACRALFVRHTVPVGVPVAIRSVGNAVRYAARRAGIATRCRGPHTLRRTIATRLLRTGASLKEVADVLRHRSLDTTAMYAKVDRKRLDAVAMEWPGGAS